MDTVFAFKGKDFVVVCADVYKNQSIFRLSDSADKILELDELKVMALAGEIADCQQFGRYIHRNVCLTRICQGEPLSLKATACFTRTECAKALRKNPFHVNILLAGCDEEKRPQLYWMDYLASMVNLDKGAHGYGAYLITSILDKHFVPAMDRAQSMSVVDLCVKELKKRFLLGQSRFILKFVTTGGVEPAIEVCAESIPKQPMGPTSQSKDMMADDE